MNFAKSANHLFKNMLNIGFTITKKGSKWEAVFVADDDGKEVHREDLGVVISPKFKVSRRVKVFQLDKKAMGIALNIIDPTKDKKTAKAVKKI